MPRSAPRSSQVRTSAARVARTRSGEKATPSVHSLAASRPASPQRSSSPASAVAKAGTCPASIRNVLSGAAIRVGMITGSSRSGLSSRAGSSTARAASRASTATTARRTACAVRPCCRVAAPQANSTSPVRVNHRPRRSAASWQAWASRPDQSTSCGPGAVNGRSPSGASASTTCALLPPMPSELTPARRGRAPVLGHERSSRTGSNGPAWRLSLGLTVRRFIVGGNCSRSSASTALMNPMIPATGPRCPTFPLTEPMPQLPGAGRSTASARYAPVSAATSIGSPREVPVPCIST